MQVLRPGIQVYLAFVNDAPESAHTILHDIAESGLDEAIFVPLDLVRSLEPEQGVRELVANLRRAFPALHIALSHPIGPAGELLAALDSRIRQALSAAGVREVDAVVLAAPESGDARGNSLLARRARQWHNHHRLPAQVALADGTGLNVAQAIAALRAQGKRAIVVGSFYLAANDGYLSMAEMALRSGALAVGGPISTDERLMDVIMARYAVAALDLLEEAEEASPAPDPEVSESQEEPNDEEAEES
jgi:sirohydrochlorin ferrochelatase